MANNGILHLRAYAQRADHACACAGYVSVICARALPMVASCVGYRDSAAAGSTDSSAVLSTSTTKQLRKLLHKVSSNCMSWAAESY